MAIDSIEFETPEGKISFDFTRKESEDFNKRMASIQNLNLSPLEHSMAFIQNIEAVKNVNLTDYKKSMVEDYLDFWYVEKTTIPALAFVSTLIYSLVSTVTTVNFVISFFIMTVIIYGYNMYQYKKRKQDMFTNFGLRQT